MPLIPARTYSCASIAIVCKKQNLRINNNNNNNVSPKVHILNVDGIDVNNENVKVNDNGGALLGRRSNFCVYTRGWNRKCNDNVKTLVVRIHIRVGLLYTT